MSDPGLAAERTDLARRRTVLPFLALAALGVRAVLHGDGPLHPWPAVALVLLACAGALVAVRGRPALLTGVVSALAVAAVLL